MVEFTENRTENTSDEIWLVEHFPVYTQGRHGKPEHIVNQKIDIPIIQSDRGGQITYHAPGQAIIYCLFDLKRLKLGIRRFVCLIEKSCIKLLKMYGVHSHTVADAPGIYVNDKKIASLGLRVKNKSTYHGIAINVNMDLSPFECINPCGYQNLKMTQIYDNNRFITTQMVFDDYSQLIIKELESC